ncbi:unnamed protein product [Closterium sp. Naga37s-1]|nr:unnamed protein product [Closterium sp. Naga37s-1]
MPYGVYASRSIPTPVSCPFLFAAAADPAFPGSGESEHGVPSLAILTLLFLAPSSSLPPPLPCPLLFLAPSSSLPPPLPCPLLFLAPPSSLLPPLPCSPLFLAPPSSLLPPLPCSPLFLAAPPLPWFFSLTKWRLPHWSPKPPLALHSHPALHPSLPLSLTLWRLPLWSPKPPLALHSHPALHPSPPLSLTLWRLPHWSHLQNRSWGKIWEGGGALLRVP